MTYNITILKNYMIDLIKILSSDTKFNSKLSIYEFAIEIMRIGNLSNFEKEIIDAALAVILLLPARFQIKSTTVAKLKKAGSPEAVRLALFYIEKFFLN